MERERFEELKHTGDMPSPTGVGMRILVLTRDEQVAMDDIVDVLQTDPALTGRVIKLASSAQAGSRVEISTLHQAAVRLGLSTVSNVALGFSLISGNRAGRCEQFDYDGYWAWSVANASAAQVIARKLGLGDASEAFTCGLLCRVGRLALASVHPSDYSEMLLQLKGSSKGLLELETEWFSLSSTEVSSAMLLDWGLPGSFADASRTMDSESLDHDFEDMETFELLRTLRAARRLADALCADASTDSSCWANLQELRSLLEIDQVVLSEIYEETCVDWQEWGELLSIPTSSPLSYSELEDEYSAAAPTASAQPAAKPAPAASAPGAPRATGETGAAAAVTKVAQFDPDSEGLRILAVDDDPVSLRILVRHLENAGHDVITATNGKDALALALETNPQIVVTDWMMPEMDGVELCKALRRFQSGRNLYVLILTGRAEEDRVVEAFDAGVDDYITKPFKPKLLLARINGGQRVVRLQQQVEYDKKLQREQVSKLAVLNRKLKAAAMTDPLTELPNRRYAMKRIENEWASSDRNRHSLTVIMLDIDRFKSVNDTYGHDVGDVVLVETARAINRCLRRGDICARMGGEEFLVICPNTDVEGAWYAAERIRTTIEANHIRFGDFDGHVTVSLGIGPGNDQAGSIDELLKIADRAVYVSKGSGRNRATLGFPPGSERESA